MDEETAKEIRLEADYLKEILKQHVILMKNLESLNLLIPRCVDNPHLLLEAQKYLIGAATAGGEVSALLNGRATYLERYVNEH